MMVKYLFKYISKGVERVRFVIHKNESPNSVGTSAPVRAVNEVEEFLNGRYICPHEAAWRIFNFLIHRRHPDVQLLPDHLENMHHVIFKEKTHLIDVLRNPSVGRTPLIGWFDSNAKDPKGLDLTYLEYPTKYKWSKRYKERERRDLDSLKTIARLVFVHHSSGELFYLRILLCHQKVCKSYQDVQTTSGRVYPTYRSACDALGLIGKDREWLSAFTEAASWASSSQLRSLFCHLLLFCEVSTPILLWEVAWPKMIDDFVHNLKCDLPHKELCTNDDLLRQHLLFELEKTLRASTPSKSLADFLLSMPSSDALAKLQNRLLLEETSYNKQSLHMQHSLMLSKLNDEQTAIYNYIVTCHKQKRQMLMFVYGHGGTGKTFIWTVILAYFRSLGKIVLAVAASGIASLLLPSGRTTHSRFNIPIDLSSKTSYDIKKKTLLADLLRQTSLIIWDEAPMSDRRCFEYLDRSLKDILEFDDNLFGGMSVLLGGDFRQTLLVSPKSTRVGIISLSLPNSYLWPAFRVFKLHQNMRLLTNDIDYGGSMPVVEFAKWLLDVGNRILGVSDTDDPQSTNWVTIPVSLLIPSGDNSLQHLISFVYDRKILADPSANDLSVRAIVCPINDVADKINTLSLQMTDGDEVTYRSTDAMQPNGKHTSELEGLYPIEFLNGLNFSGIPAHALTLKINTPIMLLRNINQREGLCNGTRLVVSQLLPNIIEATIITRTSIGNCVYIPRIKFIHNPADLPFAFSQKQFPIKVCYAMTINKSQGKYLKRIGVYLSQPVFTHGQL